MKELIYENPVDLFQVFSGDLAVKEFIDFVFRESIYMSRALDEESDDVIFPMIYEDKIKMVQIDYVFFIYLVGKFFAEKSGNIHDVMKVLKDYGLSQSSLKSKRKKKDRELLMHFFEMNLNIINNRNYDRKCLYYEVFTRKIIKKNDVDVEFKTVSLNKVGINMSVKSDDYIEAGGEYFKQKGVSQVVYGNRNVNDFWLNYGDLKRVYLMINDEDLHEIIDDNWIKNSILFNFMN